MSHLTEQNQPAHNNTCFCELEMREGIWIGLFTSCPLNLPSQSWIGNSFLSLLWGWSTLSDAGLLSFPGIVALIPEKPMRTKIN